MLHILTCGTSCASGYVTECPNCGRQHQSTVVAGAAGFWVLNPPVFHHARLEPLADERKCLDRVQAKWLGSSQKVTGCILKA
jgi:hypothetical protein